MSTDRRLRVLVADDEPAARARLRRLLAAHADVGHVVEAVDTPSALAAAQREGPFALAVLDIDMPGPNGLQLAEVLTRDGLVRCVVFSTAHAQHALDAFALGAVDYLLKPFHAERLAQSLDRVRAWVAQPPAAHAWVSTREGRRRIALADVQWVASADNYVSLHLPPQQFLERGALVAWLAQPGWAGRFVRVHRCHAVNPAHVQAVAPQAGGEALLTMRSGAVLGVSRRFREALDTVLSGAAPHSPQAAPR
ncbi:LytR/AlgR family response regulator transcription factor [Inhella crocodyli]|uniref:Response regulator transcription factor n=1 Tax=Inhella crocodyli TaxID=2499851 RepID=A0A3S2V545_9BURK|nr:LytTR family DNA-binding domain-containing protein [Inhella crocodyli]RVT88642.1 response regulator transcription factor [Inhella crocodyli]